MRGWRWMESAIREKNGGVGADIKPGIYFRFKCMKVIVV